jgi:hypothetical protein
MFRLSRKFVALLLAVWFPLFSGNALAASIFMQTMNGDCHTVQTGEHHTHHVSTAHQHMQHMHLAANQAQATEHHDQQNFSHKNCGVCQLACIGYLASATITVAAAQPSALSFTLSSTQFQSITSTPLDPPPLARA